jgi:HAMP domain-containing protein
VRRDPLLRGLRLNCILAPLLAALFGLGWALWAECAARERTVAAHHDDLRAALLGWARLLATGGIGLDAVRLADQRWRGLARIETPQPDQLRVIERSGEPPAITEGDLPLPLLEAVDAPQAWPHGNALAVAAALPNGDGQVRTLLLGAVAPPPPPPWTGFLLWTALGSALAAALSSYLALRIWRPVRRTAEWADRLAQGGSGSHQPPEPSVETRALFDSVRRLAERAQTQSAALAPTQRTAKDDGASTA